MNYPASKETFIPELPKNDNTLRLTHGLGLSLLILALCFIGMMLIAATLIGGITLALPAESPSFLYSSVTIQGIIGFIGTSILTAILVSKKPLYLLGIAKAPGIKPVAGIITAYIIAIPMLNQIIYWNSNMHLPASMAEFENILRQMEDANSTVSQNLLNGKSIWTLLLGVSIIGLLTGLSEELLFRGTLQRILGSKGAKIAAIWISAFIFSTIHFQFFGFVPRLLLGAWFGYILLWTGSTWNCAIAHAINNSMVVIVTWISNQGLNVEALDNWGVSTSGFPIMASVSGLIFILFILYCRKYFFYGK